MSYPVGPLKNRSIIKPGNYVVLSTEGRVINTVPGFEDCKLTIIASPKYGASFVQMVGTVGAAGKMNLPYAAQAHEEGFMWIMDGEGQLEITVGSEKKTFGHGGYAYSPPGVGFSFKNTNGKPCRVIIYKQRYQAHPDGRMPFTVFGDTNKIPYSKDYAGMTNVHLKDLLPIDEKFDMNMHILSFEPAGCHPFVETHVQEHGAYVFEGQGLYWLGEDWVHIQPEDFIWFGPFTKQATYATGQGPFTYIYSKDCNRDPEI